MGRHANIARYKFEEEEYRLPRLEELSLTELKTIGKTLGLHVTKYNNRDLIIADLYPIINGLKVNEKIPARARRYERVTERVILPDHRYEIFSYDGKGAITGGLSCKGVFHRSGNDGYIGVDYVPCSDDVLVVDSTVKKYDFIEGDYIVGRYMYYDKLDVFALIDVISINGQKAGEPRPAAPKVAPPQTPISLWDENDELLRAMDALCPPAAGESLLIAHEARFRTPELMLAAAAKWKTVYPETQTIGVYLMPPKMWDERIRATEATAVDGCVPPDMAFEAVETACARAERLAVTGKKVLLCVYNAHYLTHNGDFADMVRLLSAPVAYENGGSLTVFVSVNAEAYAADKLGLIEGFADCEFYLTADEAGVVPDFARSGWVRGDNETQIALKKKAAEDGNRQAFAAATRI